MLHLAPKPSNHSIVYRVTEWGDTNATQVFCDMARVSETCERTAILDYADNLDALLAYSSGKTPPYIKLKDHLMINWRRS